MTVRPISFSGPMIRALSHGQKNQTRRLLKPSDRLATLWPLSNWGSVELIGDNFRVRSARFNAASPEMEMPYQPGDLLWVREEHTFTQHGTAVYRADATDAQGFRWSSITPGDPENEVLWRPSKEMPRACSRFTLSVTEVRVQRLQQISTADAIAEGISPSANSQTIDCETPDPRHAFRGLWDSTYAERDGGAFSWASNPWVVAVSFEVIRANVAQVLEASNG